MIKACKELFFSMNNSNGIAKHKVFPLPVFDVIIKSCRYLQDHSREDAWISVGNNILFCFNEEIRSVFGIKSSHIFIFVVIWLSLWF
jgi:hypothetical protein